MTRAQNNIFIASAVLVLIGSINSPVLLIYPIFVLAVVKQWQLPTFSSVALQFFIVTILCTMFLESTAWLDNYLKNPAVPLIFHPQLFPDLLISLGMYIAWWLTWFLILNYYHFTYKEVFITTALYGILIEQKGKVFFEGLNTFPIGILLWLFVALAYGSTISLAFYLMRHRFNATNNKWYKYLVAFVGLFICTIVIFYLWGMILLMLDILPVAKLPMKEHLFW